MKNKSKKDRLSPKNVKWNESRFILDLLVITFSILTLWPLLGLVGEGLYGINQGSISLTLDDLEEIKGTLLLVIFSLLIGGGVGTINGWLLANCKFPGKEILKICQLIPLATPAYLLAATLIDLGSIHSIRINGLFWGVVIMAFTTYPYVF